MSQCSLLDELEFKSYKLNDRKEIMTATDTTGRFFIKIQVKANPRKAKNIQQEYMVMSHLNKSGCQTCPVAHEFGEISKQEVISKSSAKATLEAASSQTFSYIIQDFVPHDESYGMADILLSLIEQKALGVYQGDVKPANIRFNSATGVCILIDYDQSILLNKRQLQMNNLDYLEFCSEYDRVHYGFGDWLRHFHSLTSLDVMSVMSDASLDLAKTALLKLQKTTNSVSGVYHTIRSPDVYADGSRTINQRAQLLDSACFDLGERVLDVGCNTGLLSWYLHDRGCKTTGVDNDPHVIIAAKIVANILGKEIAYSCLDLDEAKELDEFDTIMLFSVFHHTKYPILNAKKIIRSCKRIIIETRLIENGKQPTENGWVDTTGWRFEDLDKLIAFFEQTFTGFQFQKNLGNADKGRYVLEFRKI